MTKGALIFSFDNSEIDYISLAAYSAKRISNFLNVPVSLITNDIDKANDYRTVFDQIISFEDNSRQIKRFYTGSNEYKSAVWFNESRSNAFVLSPYDQTLVLDSDYIVNCDFLKYCWAQNEDFLLYDNSMDLASWRSNEEFKNVSDCGIKFYWATVFFFRKTKRVELFFALVDHIKQNWQYYLKLYHLPGSKFRNDYAFSIAINILDGFSKESNFQTFANKMIYVTDRDILLEHTQNRMKFLLQKKGKIDEYTLVTTDNLDVHVMSKFSLLEVIKNNE